MTKVSVTRVLTIVTEPRGFGFVIFQDAQGVENVFTEATHMIDGKIVECKRAVPKDVIKPTPTKNNASTKKPAEDKDRTNVKKLQQLTTSDPPFKLFEYLSEL